jgi:uridylate kinase
LGDLLKVAISLGGSIFSKDEGVDVKFVKRFSKAILEASREHKIFIVTGGGKTARKYIRAGRELGADEDFLDMLGIWATRLNALTISASLGERGIDFVPKRVEEADNVSEEKIFVMGGTVPGHTTDAVTALLAAYIDADLLINATNVDGVYERDPKKYPGAKRLEKLSPQELIEIVETEDYEAGTSTVIDPKAARIIKKKDIRTVIVDGRSVRNIIDAIKGKVKGTVIEN